MARVLIGWASRAGAASDVAEVLASELRTAGHDVDVADVRNLPSAEGRDLVVLGSGVQAGQWYPEATAWISANRTPLEASSVAVFNVCLNAANPSKRDESLGYNRAVLGQLAPVAQESFGGRYVPERVSWFKRLFLRTLQKQAQDHVDEDAVRAWGRTLAQLVSR